jgi:predicted O-methyltransferase YrrM
VNFNKTILKKILYFRDFAKLIENIPGAVIELGFGYGHSALALASLDDHGFQDRNIYFFDSFAGFPKVSVFDLSHRKVRQGDWSHRTKAEAIKQLQQFLESDKLPNRIKFVQGLVEQTLPEFSPPQIALLHIDLDLYSAHKITLEKLFNSVVVGGVVIFDDYNDPKWPGATKATQEFFGDKIVLLSKHESGKYYLIKR